MDSILCFLERQDLQDFGDFLSPAARGPLAGGRFILTILFILSEKLNFISLSFFSDQFGRCSGEKISSKKPD